MLKTDLLREHLINEGMYLLPVGVEEVGLVARLPLRWVEQRTVYHHRPCLARIYLAGDLDQAYDFLGFQIGVDGMAHCLEQLRQAREHLQTQEFPRQSQQRFLLSSRAVKVIGGVSRAAIPEQRLAIHMLLACWYVNGYLSTTVIRVLAIPDLLLSIDIHPTEEGNYLPEALEVDHNVPF